MNFVKMLFFLLLWSFPNYLISQYSNLYGSDLADLNDKYWYYRYRLNSFVQVGTNPGNSTPSNTRWHEEVEGGGSIHWAQEAPRDLGAYIGVLTTEYELLFLNQASEEELQRSLTELFFAMEAIDRLDLAAEPIYNQNPNLDGFLVRNDVEHDDPITGAPYNLTELNESIYQMDPGVARTRSEEVAEMNAMSQDKYIALLVGLTLVVKTMPNSNLMVNLPAGAINFNFHTRAQDYIERMIEYIADGDPSFKLYEPDGGEVIAGENARFFARPFKLIYNQYTNSSMNLFAWDLVQWDGVLKFAAYGQNNCNQVCNLVAMSNSIGTGTITIEATGGTHSTVNGYLSELANINDWEGFYTLLNIYLHDKNKSPESNTFTQLLEAPPCGPGNINDHLRNQFNLAEEEEEGEENGYQNPFQVDYRPDNWMAPYKWWANYSLQNDLELSDCFPRIDEMQVFLDLIQADFSALAVECEHLGGGSGVGQGRGLHSGLDYMLYYNLYRLVECPLNIYPIGSRYERRDFANLTQNFPYNLTIPPNITITLGNSTIPVSYNWFHSGRASNTIDLEGVISIRAGHHVSLIPGFNSKKGSRFIIDIDPFNCSLEEGVIQEPYEINSTIPDGFVDQQTEINGHYMQQMIVDNGIETEDGIGVRASLNRLDYDNENLEIQSRKGTDNENNKNSQIRMYPNPVRDEINLLNVPNHCDRIDIYSINGQQVFSVSNFVSQGGKARLDISELVSGIYLVEVHGENSVIYMEKLTVL